MNELALFAGAGGGLLGTQHLLGWQTICYVEWNKYAVEVLKARIRDGYLDDAPIWDDCFTFDGRPWAGLVDVVTAGFPCQPFSSAGKGLAEHDPRNGWPAVIRILREVQPRFAFLENVPGLLSKPYYRRILGDLAEAGFNIEQDCISAQEIGAPHIRQRLWIVSHSNRQSFVMDEKSRQEKLDVEWDGTTQQMADIWNSKHQGNRWVETSTHSGKEKRNVHNSQWWEVEPKLGRVADGVAYRMDRLEAIGNGQVPAVVAEAWKRLSGEQ